MLLEKPLFSYPFDMISVCILTKNAAATLKKTLDSIVSFNEVILLDNGSSDATLEIARQYPNVKVHSSPFIGFGALRNEAAKLASHDWILALDSDEILSDALIKELHALEKEEQVAYLLPRHNYYSGKRIRGCGWDFEEVARLYHKNFAKFCNSKVHETLDAVHFKKLPFPILHTPYRTTADFLEKMQRYSTLFAEQHRGKKRSSFSIALMHALYAFFRSYVLKKGVFCGKEGFIISLYNANTTFYKYLKLKDLNKAAQKINY